MPTGIYKRTSEMFLSRRGKSPWNKGKIGIYSQETLKKMSGENNPGWKGGISLNRKVYNKEYNKNYREKNRYILNEKKRNLRHQLGISKLYRDEWLKRRINPFAKSNSKEYKRFYRRRYKTFKKNGGILSIQTIQQVYEDNIKQFNTLTCYLCLKPITFGKDHLEHKIPLSRGGTNIKDNLDIACQKCNNKKYNKTEIEYKEGVKIYAQIESP